VHRSLREVAEDIRQVSTALRVDIPPGLDEPLAAYLTLLAHWNRKINLTALDVATPSRESIERLIVEPLVAAPFVAAADRLCVDIGSGGGSPAIPLKLARPHLEMVLVESRGRKAAFLREAARQLQLTHVCVEQARAETLANSEALRHRADLVTARAVRMDRPLVDATRMMMAPKGRLFWFRKADESVPDGGAVLERIPLPGAADSELTVYSYT
jgi:16S rRNA (guanine527-N7)-methyltransferase